MNVWFGERSRPFVPSDAATWKAAGNDCLTRRIDQTAHPVARSLRGWSGEATNRSKPSDNVPTIAKKNWHQNREATVYLRA
jgi:hypothetical protein